MSRQIVIGGKGSVKKLAIGGGAPISIQSMWKEPLLGADISSILDKLDTLSKMGADIMRFAVPDMESATILTELSKRSSVPLVADIHFDYRLALACMEGNIAAVRINPGNIGSIENVKSVVKCAKDTGTVLRIGVNTGSLPKDILGESLPQSLVSAAMYEVNIFEQLGFTDYAVSLKASNVEDTVQANMDFAAQCDAPLHLGVTEAGPPLTGAIKTSIAFYRLLSAGVGDTIRVSLSSSCEQELIAGREILRSLGKSTQGVHLVSCPRCGRNGFDVHSFVKRWEHRLFQIKKNYTIAVMGCAVNGPGEAKNADLGISGGKDFAIIFRNGKIVQNISLKNMTTSEQEKKIDEIFEHELALL